MNRSMMTAFMLTLVMGFAATAYAADVSEGKALYLGEKYKCYTCHGKNGEGASGPSFKGLGKKYSQSEMLKRAAHMCPPTGACNPKDLEAIISYLRTV